MTEEDFKPPEESAGDYIHRIIRAAVGSAPAAGAAASELFDFAIAAPMAKRLDAWRQNVGRKLAELASSDRVSIEDLQSNEAFVTSISHATQAAIRNHQVEKLELLRNAVLNSALPNPPDESIQQIFINMVDELTVSHIKVLTLFQDPPAWFAANGRPTPKYGMGVALVALLKEAYAEFVSRHEFADLIANDLNGRGLLSVNQLNIGMSSGGAVLAKRTTDFGDQFLTFVSEPQNL